MWIDLRSLWESSGSPDVTVALTGVFGTGSAGSLAVAFGLAPTGVEGTGAVGSVALSISASLSGNAGTGAVGSVSLANSLALIGAGGTGSVGAVAPLSALPLPGSTATGSVGSIAPSFGLTLTGNEATGAVGTISVAAAADVTAALSGVGITAAVGTLTASVVNGSVEFFSGGYFPRSPGDIKRRRIELGILPPEEEKQAERAIEQVVQATAALAKAKPETQAATDALKAQDRAEKLFSEAYRKVYPALEQAQILEAMQQEAQRLQEEEYAFVLSLL